MTEQITIFDFVKAYKISKPIRLIELFGGIGSQATALRNIGAEFDHYRLCEYDKYAVTSYNAIHGTKFKASDIRDWRGSDLGIADSDKYEYILTYSFPCQDLSIAGKGHGMAKGKGTRSGLLWEVERLLNECGQLPQVLVMENVPQVHGTANMEDFQQWIASLADMGYMSYWRDLNAKDYGIPQSRNRCYMVSLLSSAPYRFPQSIVLEKQLRDMLEQNVDKKYYLSAEIVRHFEQAKAKHKANGNGFNYAPTSGDGVAKCITASGNSRADDNFVKINIAGNLHGDMWDNVNDMTKRVYDDIGLSPTLSTCGGGNTEVKILQRPRGYNKGGAYEICPNITKSSWQENNMLSSGETVRKLTPREYWRLMGQTDSDFDKARQALINTHYNGKDKATSQLYKQAGNSIVVNMLEALFSNMIEQKVKVKGVE